MKTIMTMLCAAITLSACATTPPPPPDCSGELTPINAGSMSVEKPKEGDHGA